jgi:hypothetical protein
MEALQGSENGYSVLFFNAINAKYATTELARREMPFRISLKYRSELPLDRPLPPAHDVVLAKV